MAFKPFPVRYAITTDKDSYNIVLMVDNIEKHFMTVRDYKIGGYIEKVAAHYPLFIVEEPRLIFNDPQAHYTKNAHLFEMLVRQLTDLKANLYIVPNAQVPRYYTNSYKNRGIAEKYHKALWLCTFNVHFDDLENKYKNV